MNLKTEVRTGLGIFKKKPVDHSTGLNSWEIGEFSLRQFF